MELNFWHDRWEKNLTGFHLDEVNSHLKENWAALNLKAASRVFVPLCGKTLDLIWLADQGHEVVGIELSQIAVKAFFDENKLTAQVSNVDGLELWQSGNISLYCGDFFTLTPAILGKIDAVYDRASLVALPPAMRQDYASKLAELTKIAPKLLVTLEYDQSKMDGPPFSVSEEEVKSLYGANYQVKKLIFVDVLAENVKFREKGLSEMGECIYQLKPIT